ncbi:hypothetical protein [Streptomyces sp. RFCAC02]|uniref:hypothetical protein n=1 Tax=Streptomyces sp. RFCAC02 TaxID=2499143 RepID=UPI0010212039|nr:hypothetical protein [Streptomyces sp. RFCAC02]
MARGRHRHSALHRVLIPAALGGGALLCAAATWLVGDILAARVLAAVAAFAAVSGAALLRRWDVEASRRVAREKASAASLSWQLEERQAEVEESRELVAAMEEKVGAKRAELGRLRTEHADLLRRYATAESERARALEGRRRLALEAAEPARALTTGAADHRTRAGAPTPLTYLQAHEALRRLGRPAPAPEPVPAPAAGERRQLPPSPRVTTPIQRTGGGFDFFGTGGGAGPRKNAGATARDHH